MLVSSDSYACLLTRMPTIKAALFGNMSDCKPTKRCRSSCMHQRSVMIRGWLSGVMALLFTAGCLPAPLRVGATAIGKETSIRSKPTQVIVGASDHGPSAALGSNMGQPAAVAAPIISHNGGNVLQ